MNRVTLWRQVCTLALAFVVVVIGCAPAQTQTSGSSSAPQPQQAAGPKRLTVAMMGNPAGALDNFAHAGSGGGVPGGSALEQMVGSALTPSKERGAFVAILAESIPSFENGLWKVFPDGRMETTWKIRSGTQWHDGTPFTAHDVIFTSKLEQDKDLPVRRSPVYELVASMDAPDPQTLTVTWKSSFIEAAEFFARAPVPRHILEKPYMENKETFLQLPYWTTEYVGAGPYQIKEWSRDSHAVLQAFDGFVLGRPKIDEIVVKFLEDENAFIANILAGTVELTIGKSINIEQAKEVMSRWTNGRMEARGETVVKMWPQFLDPNPAVILDVRLRKAIFHAINRQELVDTLVGREHSAVAHSVLLPSETVFAEGEKGAVKYDYDPRKAAELIESIGYRKGADGIYRDGNNQVLSLEINATDEAQNTKPMFAVAEYWKQVGIAAESLVIPVQRQDDRQYRATFAGFNLQGSGSGVSRIKELTSSQARLPENNYNGRNYPRYRNAEFDDLVVRLFATIPMPERIALLQKTIEHMTDQVNMISLYYAPTSTLINNRVQNAGFDPSWNAYEWDVQ